MSNVLNEYGQFVLTDNVTSAVRVSVDVNSTLLNLPVGSVSNQRNLIILNDFNYTDLTRLAGVDVFELLNIAPASAK